MEGDNDMGGKPNPFALSPFKDLHLNSVSLGDFELRNALLLDRPSQGKLSGPQAGHRNSLEGIAGEVTNAGLVFEPGLTAPWDWVLPTHSMEDRGVDLWTFGTFLPCPAFDVHELIQNDQPFFLIPPARSTWKDAKEWDLDSIYGSCESHLSISPPVPSIWRQAPIYVYPSQDEGVPVLSPCIEMADTPGIHAGENALPYVRDNLIERVRNSNAEGAAAEQIQHQVEISYGADAVPEVIGIEKHAPLQPPLSQSTLGTGPKGIDNLGFWKTTLIC